MRTPPRQSSVRHALWRGAPVALTVLVGVGYLLAVALIDGAATEEHPLLLGVLVLAQAAVLLPRARTPFLSLAVVVALDAVILLLSSGEVSIGTFAVMVAVYSYCRERRDRPHVAVPAALALASIAVTLVAVQSSDEVPGAWALPFSIFRGAMAIALPVVLAEIIDGRARLVEALRERADAAERERERLAQDAVREERALMARELHDIAAHHLTGIIVSAQAAGALRSRDPERAGEYIRRVESDARTTLNNLRQTVGLLRTESEGSLAPAPSIEHLPALVTDASGSGSPVSFSEIGTPRELGPLAGIAVYRMVQESLANARQHAPGASCSVELEYGESALRVTVNNEPVPAERAPGHPSRDGFGLLGMAERAELIGAALRTGRTPDGGWTNRLEIPYDGVES